MTYYSLGDQLFNATMLSLLFGLLGSACGMFWPMFRSAFLSIGMLMIFSAWLDWINFDGSYPSGHEPAGRRQILPAVEPDVRSLEGGMMKQLAAAMRTTAGAGPKIVRALTGLRGVRLVCYGAWTIYPPAGFITASILLIALGNRTAG